MYDVFCSEVQRPNVENDFPGFGELCSVVLTHCQLHVNIHDFNDSK